SRDEGTSSFWCRAWSALRMRASRSATGSVTPIDCFSFGHPFAPACRGTCGDGNFKLLPGRLRYPGNLSPKRQPAEAQPADAELAQESARTPTQPAAVALTDRLDVTLTVHVPELRGLLVPCRLGHPRCGCHVLACRLCRRFFLLFHFLLFHLDPLLRLLLFLVLGLPEGHAQMLEQVARLLVRLRRGHDGHVHAPRLVHLGVIDLREDQLLLQAEGEVAAPVERPG